MDNQRRIKVLENAHLILVELIDNLSEDKRQKIKLGRWVLKEIIGHLSAWNKLDIDHLKSIKNNLPFKWITSVNDFNRRAVEERESLTWEQVYKEFVNSGRKLIQMYYSLPDTSWQKKFGPDGKITLRKDISGMIRHYQGHYEQISSYIEKSLQS